MCYGVLQYQCSHSAKARINCRQTWRKRTGWICYPLIRLICGPGPEQPCDEIRPDKYWWVANSCRDCRKVEQSDSKTKGRIHDRYRDRLTHAELQRSRRRMEEEKRLDEIERGMYRDERIQFQKMRREAREEQRNNYNGNSNGNDSINGSNIALPIMPTFVHVPLGDQRGYPGYQQPSQIATANPPAPSPEKPQPELPQNPHDEDKQDEPVAKDKKQWWKHLPPAEDLRALQSGRFGDRDSTKGKHVDDGRNPYRPYENDIPLRSLTHPRSNREAPPSSPAQGSPRLIADRRGKPLEPLKDIQSSHQTPVKQAYGDSPQRKGLKRLLSSATRSDSRSEARTDSMASESSSFACQDSRAVERGS